MNKETLENDAHLAVKEEYDIDYADEKSWIQGYIAGATAQHPKARNEAIDDCINYLFHHFPSNDATSSIIYGLNSLKLDPNEVQH